MRTPAERRIAAEIRADGPITFARFMELALYDPEVGYYMRPEADVGADGDYVTSPELHPAFGLLLCTQLEEMWRHLGRPSPFWVIEAGPGRGTLAHDVLATAQAAFPVFATALRVALIERSPTFRDRQAATLRPWADRATWLDADPKDWTALGPGCIVANELLDALPVHRVVMRADGLREIFVGLDGERLVEVEGAPSSPDLAGQIAAGGGRLGIGHRGEVNVLAPAWVRAASRLIERGYLFLLDYGAPADQLYGSRHPRGTLLCYSQHVMNEDPFAWVGLQDMTAHVDFSAVTRAALEAGLTLVGATEQCRLLGRLGLSRLAEELDRSIARRADLRAQRSALHLLGDPRGLGRVLAVAYGKQAPMLPLAGFTLSTPHEPPRVDGIWTSLRLDPRRLRASMSEPASAAPDRPPAS